MFVFSRRGASMDACAPCLTFLLFFECWSSLVDLASFATYAQLNIFTTSLRMACVHVYSDRGICSPCALYLCMSRHPDPFSSVVKEEHYVVCFFSSTSLLPPLPLRLLVFDGERAVFLFVVCSEYAPLFVQPRRSLGYLVPSVAPIHWYRMFCAGIKFHP